MASSQILLIYPHWSLYHLFLLSSWSFSISLPPGPLAGMGSLASLTPLPSHALNQVFIDQSEMVEDNFYITWNLEMLAHAIIRMADRYLGIETRPWGTGFCI